MTLAEWPAFDELRRPTPAPDALSNHVTATAQNDYRFKFKRGMTANQVRQKTEVNGNDK